MKGNQTAGRQRGRINTAVIVLTLLLVACVAAIGASLAGMRVIADSPVYVTIPDDMILADRQETVTVETVSRQAQLLSLYNKNPHENVPFQMNNMFPGDSKTQYYSVSVSYMGTITVIFQASAETSSEKLGEILEVRVRLINTDEVLYEGKFADMPELKHVLTTDSEPQTEELYYEITVGVSTSVGNEYQNKSLAANLSWWTEVTGSPDEPEDPTEPSEPEGVEDPTEPSDPEKEEPAGPSGSEWGEELTEPLVPKGKLTNSPGTRDDSQVMLWLAVFSVTLIIMILTLVKYRGSEQMLIRANVLGSGSGQLRQTGKAAQKSRRRLLLEILLAVLLFLAFGITSLALVYQKVTVEENLFQTGMVSICLNDNQPVLDEYMLFEPGMVVEKDFTLRNDSTCDVYYRLYFSDIVGEFAEALTVTVTDGENTVFQGPLAEMNGVKSEGASSLLKEGEERRMKITFHVPEDCGNVMQGRTILFDLNADAVQAVNNSSRTFESIQ